MNYYIIPKNNFKIMINPDIKPVDIKPYISYSLIYFLNDIYSQLLNIDEFKMFGSNVNSTNSNETTISYINKIVNPFEFIHTNVPGSCLSVSKVKPDSNIFFELMEVFQICNITDILSLNLSTSKLPNLSAFMIDKGHSLNTIFQSQREIIKSECVKTQINIAHLTSNNSSTIDLLNMLREDNDDVIIDIEFDYKNVYNNFIQNPSPSMGKIDLFIFEFKETDYTNINQYIKNMILVLYIIVNNQSNLGTSIIKIDNIFYKSIVDILFVFSAIFEKVFLIKPSISKITKGDRFIVCKNLNSDVISQTQLLHQMNTHFKNIMLDNSFLNSNIHSIIDNVIPYYFSNKIEESNAVIGQQQLEAYDQIINIFKNKNKEDKIEILKRNHIQKCILWCEKNQLPHNKFTDRVNIFLFAKKGDESEEKEEVNEIKEVNEIREVNEIKEVVNEIKEVDELRLEIVEVAEDKSELSIAIIPELYYKNKMPYDICEK